MGPASHMVVSVHEYYQANQMVKAGEDNIMKQPWPVWAHGPYPVVVELGEAWCCQAGANHSLPLLIRLNHCLLRQEGCTLQHHLLLLQSVTRLRLCEGGGALCFS